MGHGRSIISGYVSQDSNPSSPPNHGVGGGGEVRGKSPFFSEPQFSAEAEENQTTSKGLQDEGRPCMQRPGRVPYPWSRYSVNGIFPMTWKPRTGPGRQLRLLRY